MIQIIDAEDEAAEAYAEQDLQHQLGEPEEGNE